MHIALIPLSVSIFLVSSLASAAQVNAASKDWPVYKANAIEYFESHLPNPVVIYVYTSRGDLAGIIDNHGHHTPTSIQSIGNILTTESFLEDKETSVATSDEPLKHFLLDQGYSIGDIVNKSTKYTMLITLWNVKASDCQEFTEVQQRYKDAVDASIRNHPSGKPTYSVAIMKLDSPAVKLGCKA